MNALPVLYELDAPSGVCLNASAWLCSQFSVITYHFTVFISLSRRRSRGPSLSEDSWSEEAIIVLVAWTGTPQVETHRQAFSAISKVGCYSSFSRSHPAPHKVLQSQEFLPLLT